MTPYQFAGNKPIWSKELEGLQSEQDQKEVEKTKPTEMDFDELDDNYEDGPDILERNKVELITKSGRK